MKKKIILIILLTLLSYLSLACTNQSSDNTKTPTQETTTEEITSEEQETTQEQEITSQEILYEVKYYIFPETYDESHNNFLEIDDAIIDVKAGMGHSLALTSQGKVFAWGQNTYGQLGNSTFDQKILPLDISQYFELVDNETIIQISAGAIHSAALSSNHRLFTWGNNDHHQLGDGTFGPSSGESTPKDITDEFSLESGEYIESIAMGTFHSSALTSEGRLFLWGNNELGQIGNNSTSNQALPLDVTEYLNLNANESIIQVELANTNTAVLTNQNRLLIWGDNYYGQLGNGNNNNSSLPIDISASFNLQTDEVIQSISLGVVHAGALTNKGNLYMWGYNGEGLLGNESGDNSNIPLKINDFISLDENESIQKIELGGNHSSLITSNHQVYTWGQNTYGELGNNTSESQNKPININAYISLDEDDSINMIHLGIQNSYIITEKGSIYAFGKNTDGELGNNNSKNQMTPIMVNLNKIELFHTHMFIENSNLEFNFDENLSLSPWYLDLELSNQVNQDYIVTENLNLYAYLID
ncbi:hypothetical protein HF295_07345 [Hujiaoplasma nucleasis]|uniref:RCC1-like domain-containing protein n=1 Tax=Hujiaoplasma nucleasis TaxID=2725268 RepID=A0A7L6N324_9MOLU|nr:hypothetical protein [Hujiaoplasma nucleasis]QLY40670.1 hypothetical protein HF295_07345 [Hujiaoplasma nucleasis]